MTKLILIRHGQSLWNAENKFTGWVDSPLSSLGKLEAKKAGLYLKNHKISFDICYTSFLLRAIKTLDILLKESRNDKFKVIKSWELNERHYGDLTGLNKLDTKNKLGATLFNNYRRSWDIAPPIMSSDSPNLNKFSPLNKLIPIDKIPKTESLKDTYIRVLDYYTNNIELNIKNNKTVIITAHGNSLRALCKYIFNITDKKINKLEIPTGNPMIIQFNEKLEATNAYYLDNDRSMPILNL